MSNNSKQVVVESSLGFNVHCKEINDVLYADFSKSDKWLPEKWLSGKIVFQPLYPQKINTYSFAKFVDIEAGIQFAMIHPSLSKNKEVTFDKIEINGRQDFNLADRLDRIKAFILYHQEFIKNGPNEGGNLLMEVFDVERQVIIDRQNRKNIRQAWKIIEDLEGVALRDFARLMIPLTNDLTDEMIKGQLEEIADDNPAIIIEEWNKSDRVINEIFKRSEKTGIIKYYDDIGYKYGQITVGLNYEEAIRRLKEDTELRATLHRKSMSIINGKIEEAEKALESKYGHQQVSAAKKSINDKSITDVTAEAAHSPDGVQAEEFKKMFGEIKSIVESAVDSKVNPLLKEFHSIKEKVNSIDYNIDVPNEDDGVVEKIIEDAKNGIIHSKELKDWKLNDIQEFVRSNFTIDEYADHITKKKADLYAWLTSEYVKKLEEGVLL